MNRKSFMRSELLYLQDIVEAVDSIERFLANVAEDAFLSNDLLQSAVLLKLSIIGEAASNVPGELRSRYPETPWKQIVGFRNIAVHVYFALEWETVWVAATEDAPALRDQIRVIIQREFPDFEPGADN